MLHVRFDPAGNVASVEQTGKELVDERRSRRKRTTPTLGRKRSFFDELFGNIGTVGAAGLPGAAGSNAAVRRRFLARRAFS